MAVAVRKKVCFGAPRWCARFTAENIAHLESDKKKAPAVTLVYVLVAFFLFDSTCLVLGGESVAGKA